VPPPPPPPAPAPAPPFPPPPATSRAAATAPGAGITAPSGARSGGYDGGPDLAGTVYGGGTDGPAFATVALPTNAVENSGSLTGHILAQGWADTPAEKSRSTRAMIVLAVALGLLVLISVLLVLVAGDAVSGLVGNVLAA